MANPNEPLAERFNARVLRTDGCWLWTGKGHPKGYGRILDHKKYKLVHRVAYELAYGPIPDELTIDHLCMTKLCVRPDHLEVVTRAENTRRYLRWLYSKKAA